MRVSEQRLCELAEAVEFPVYFSGKHAGDGKRSEGYPFGYRIERVQKLQETSRLITGLELIREPECVHV